MNCHTFHVPLDVINTPQALHALRKVTLPRLINAVRVYRSYRRSLRTGIPQISGFPISLSIEPTTSCNLRCPQCPSGLRQFTRPTGMQKPAFFDQILNEVSKTVGYITLYFQGEPFLNPGFADMVRSASERKIFTATSTNAHFLDETRCEEIVRAGLDKLIVSVDGITQDSYSKYRVGGSLNKALDGIRKLIETKRKLRSKTPFVTLQFIVFSHNEHEISDVKRIAKELGVDQLEFKTAQVYDEEGISLLPANPEFSRYEIDEGKTKIKGILPDHCWRMWHSCVITWDGLVVPCCFDKDANYQLGDLKKENFSDVWLGEKYNAFRQRLLDDRKGIDICNNCSEGAQVWI